ncbi:MAG: TRAM domain-containing protein [Candidatus Woesearchaeota archaeon]
MNNKQTNNSQTAPVTVGEVIKAKVLSVGEKGDGIIRTKGFVVFVPNVQAGDFVKVKITKVSSKVGFGELVEKLDELPPQQNKVPTPEELKNRFKGPKEDVSELLTTEGDSEEF